MKKSFILFAIITANLTAKAQIPDLPIFPPDSSLYDTMVVFNPVKDAGFPIWGDTIPFTFQVYTADTFQSTYTKDPVTGEWIPVFDSMYNIAEYTINYTNILNEDKWKLYPNAMPVYHSSAKNLYDISEFAQPWHLDSNALICGIYVDWKAPKMFDYRSDQLFSLYDTNFNPLTSCMQFSTGGGVFVFEDGTQVGENMKWYHSFYFDQQVKVKDFYLGAMVSTNGVQFFGHTPGIFTPEYKELYNKKQYPYDTIFVGKIPTNFAGVYKWGDIAYSYTYPPQPAAEIYFYEGIFSPISDTLIESEITDTIPLYQSPYPPYMKKSGQWMSFADDSIYTVDQKRVLKFLPIIMVPKVQQDTTAADTSSIKDALLEENLWIYPNPARDKVKIYSGFRMTNAEIFNSAGIKIREEKLSDNETVIDVNGLEKGTYIIKVYTTRGAVSRKLIIQ